MYRFVNINHKQNKILNYVKLNTHYPLKSPKIRYSRIPERERSFCRIFDSLSLKNALKALKIST